MVILHIQIVIVTLHLYRYCQGMGMVVSTLLLILEEGEVFWLLSCIIEDHLPSHYYNTNLFGIQVISQFNFGIIT